MERDPSKRLLKRSLRRQMVAAVMSIVGPERSSQQARLIKSVAGLPGLDQAGTVLLYVNAFPEELNTRPLLTDALSRGQRLICPRVDQADRRLRLFQIVSLSTDLVPGMLGIPEPRAGLPEVEPREVDWALVPGLAFDERCFRLGRGGGFYDRLLPTLRPTVPRWAIGFDCQLIPELPVEPHDIPVDGVVTPHRFFQRLELR